MGFRQQRDYDVGGDEAMEDDDAVFHEDRINEDSEEEEGEDLLENMEE